jgi:hypothetical protein
MSALARPWCAICEWRPARKLGRCLTCYAYLHRTGHDRPEALVVREAERVLARQSLGG